MKYVWIIEDTYLFSNLGLSGSIMVIPSKLSSNVVAIVNGFQDKLNKYIILKYVRNKNNIEQHITLNI